MKKYIKQILLLALVVSFVSCTEDEEVPMTAVGGNVVLTTTSINNDAYNVPINLKTILVPGVTVSKIEVYNNTQPVTTKPVILGSKLADATIVDANLATFSSSTLNTGGVWNYPANAAGARPIRIALVTTFSDGTSLNNPYTLTVKAPL